MSAEPDETPIAIRHQTTLPRISIAGSHSTRGSTLLSDRQLRQLHWSTHTPARNASASAPASLD